MPASPVLIPVTFPERESTRTIVESLVHQWPRCSRSGSLHVPPSQYSATNDSPTATDTSWLGGISAIPTPSEQQASIDIAPAMTISVRRHLDIAGNIKT